MDEAGNERYRAYFTADFLWHAALTAELARFDMPPKDPYAGDHTLNYYWAYFLLPGSAMGTDPFGLWPSAIPILKVNRILSGLLFIGMLAVLRLVARAAGRCRRGGRGAERAGVERRGHLRHRRRASRRARASTASASSTWTPSRRGSSAA